MVSSFPLLKAAVLLIVFSQPAFAASAGSTMTTTSTPSAIPSPPFGNEFNMTCPQSCFDLRIKYGTSLCSLHDIVCLCEDPSARMQVENCVAGECPTREKEALEIAMKLCGHTTSSSSSSSSAGINVAPRHEGHDHSHHDHHGHGDQEDDDNDHDHGHHDHDGHHDGHHSHDNASVEDDVTSTTPAPAPVKDAGVTIGSHVAGVVVAVGGIAAVMAGVM